MVDNPQSINLIRFDMESHFVFTPLHPQRMPYSLYFNICSGVKVNCFRNIVDIAELV